MSCLVIDLGPCQVDIQTNQQVYNCVFDPGRDGFVSQSQRGRLMVGVVFNLRSSIIDCKTCKLMPVYDRPMHFETADGFSSTFSWVKAGVVKKHKYIKHHPFELVGHWDPKL
jgi:hypothetical protein